MSLRIQQEALLANSIENLSLWGWPATVTSPDAQVENMTAITQDIGEVIDADTGVQVSGRHATATFRIQTVLDLFGELPEVEPSQDALPWRIAFDDINGNAHLFSVVESRPDRMMGVIVLILQHYIA